MVGSAPTLEGAVFGSRPRRRKIVEKPRAARVLLPDLLNELQVALLGIPARALLVLFRNCG
jgi:hypothetical protein